MANDEIPNYEGMPNPEIRMRNRGGRSFGIRYLVFGLLSSLGISSFVIAIGPDEDLPEIRRVLIRPEQVPAELERVRRGVLRQLPRAEFDDLLARATSAANALHDPPRLAETHYRAELVGESLAGSAVWKIVHRNPTAGLLAVEPFNLALRTAAWDDGSPALIGDLDTRPQAPGMELLVGRPGEQGLTFGWSTRGVPEPGGLRFDLRLPPCPIAVLDLDLPADREPTVPHDGGLLTGPMPGGAADRHLWRLAFAAASQIDLTIRRPFGDGPPPLTLSTQRTRQDVTPGQTECEFAFNLEASHGGVRDLTLTCDRSLRPTEVAVRNLDRWEVRLDKEATRVLVHLGEPLQSGALTLRAIAPTAPDRAWTSPAAAVVGAVPRGESLTVRVHPDLQADDWRAGPFRLIESVVTPDHWQVLTLQAGPIRSSAGRPAAVLRPAGPDYQVRERLWWFAAADRMTLAAQIEFQVTRGPVFEVPLRLPAAWTVERLESDPPDLLAAADPATKQQTLPVELQRPLTPTTSGRLTVHLVRRRSAGKSDEPIPFPDVIPTAARTRTGTLAFKAGPGLEWAVTDAPPPSKDEAESNPERSDSSVAVPSSFFPGEAPPDAVYPLRATPAEGKLRLRLRAATVRARVSTDVVVTGRQAAVACRLRLEPESAGADGVIVRVDTTGVPWDWRVVQGANRVRSVLSVAEPPPRLVGGLAALSPWQALVAAGLPAEVRPNSWQITFTRPLTEPTELEAHAVFPVPADASWVVPLVRVPAAEPSEVTVDLRSAPGRTAQPAGMVETTTADGSPRRRSFRYGVGPASLTLVPNAGAGAADRAWLVTYATDPGRLVHRLTMNLHDWAAPTVAIELPADAVVQDVRVNGKIQNLDPVPQLNVRVPVGSRSVVIEVVYTTPRPAGGMLTRVVAEAPRLPLADGGLRRVWCLTPDVVPLWSRDFSKDAPDRPIGGPPPGIPVDIANGVFWEPINDTVGGTLLLVRPRDLGMIGGVVAIAGLALAWAGRTWSPRRQWTGLLVWLTLTAAAAVWLPGPLAAAAFWPFLAAIAVTVSKLLPTRSRRESHRPSTKRQAAVVGGCLAVGMCSLADLNSPAAAPAPTLIYLVPGPEEGEPRTVLAPPDLLDRLRTLTRRGPAGLDRAAWIDARYEGRVDGNRARLTATLRLHAFADDPPPLTLPFSGVQLGDATLDGAPAFLRTAGDRYLASVHGRGPHTLVVTFDAPCPPSPAAAGERVADRELQFGVPEIPISHLTLAAPAGATQLRSSTGRGEQRVETDADIPRLDVDLGRVGAVHVSWRDSRPGEPHTSANAAATVHTRESYLWDLNESAARLLGAVRFDVTAGTVNTFAVTLPRDIEVATVAARPVRLPSPAKPGDANSSAGWLRSWRIAPPAKAGGRRSLVLEFAHPIGGAWQVNLELVPREPFAVSFALSFPSAEGRPSAPPAFAWRADGVELSDTPPDGSKPLAPDLFLRDHWLPTRADADPRPPTKAYQRNTGSPAPTLRMRAVTGPRDQAAVEIAWQVGRRRAEFEASGRVTAHGGQVSLVEWSIPAAMTVTQVRAPDLYRWSRAGNRLQVWLARPVTEAVVEVTGYVARPAEVGPIDLPPIRPRTAALGGSLRVTATEGLALARLQTTNLKLAGRAAATAARELAFTIEGPQAYHAQFEVRPAGGVPSPTAASPKR